MKHLLCSVLVCLAVVDCSLTAETPAVELKGHTNQVTFALFSPDGKTVVTTSTDKTARIWDVELGKLLSTLAKKRDLGTRLLSSVASVIPNTVEYAAFSLDGKRIATAGHGETIRIWEVDSGKKLKPLKGESRLKGYALGIMSVAFSSDGKKVVSGCGGGTTRIWDAESGKELKILEAHTRRDNARSLMHAAFSPDGTKIVMATKTFNTSRLRLRLCTKQ